MESLKLTICMFLSSSRLSILADVILMQATLLSSSVLMKSISVRYCTADESLDTGIA